MMGVGAKQALGLYRSCAPRQIDARKAYDELVAKWTPLAPAVVRSLEEAGASIIKCW